MLHKEITDKILKSFYKVYNILGWGFLEKVYENALMIEFSKNGISSHQQHGTIIYYESEEVGKYIADIIVEEKIILELKSCEKLAEQHKNQLINYLKASNLEVGLLLNFGPKPEFNRVIFSNKQSTLNRKT